MTTAGPLWWRGLRSRPASNLFIMTLSAVVVLIAVLGPLLLRAITQSTITDAVQAAGPEGTSLTVTINGDVREDLYPLEAVIDAALAPVARGPARGLWQPAQTWIESVANVAWASKDRTTPGETSSRVRATNGCSGLVLKTGTCPTAKGQVLLSTADAGRARVQVGSVLIYRRADIPGRRFRVVGTYDADQVTAPLTRPGTEVGLTAVDGDPLITTSEQLQALPLPTQVSGRLLLRGPVTVADEPLLHRSVDDLQAAVLTQARSIAVVTRLPDVLDRVDDQSRAARILIAISEAQALALAGFALATVLQRTGRARRGEWGVGRLLGVPRRRWLRSVYAEPAIALLAGVPVGLAAGVVLARTSVNANLVPGTPVEFLRWPVLVAAVAAGLVALLVLVAVSLPSLRQSLATLLSEHAEPTRSSRFTVVAQAVVVLLAAASGYDLLAGGVLGTSGSHLGLLAPALFALGLALVAVRISVLIVRRVTRHPPRRLGALVVGRQLARTPSALTPAVVMAVGVALTIFATQVLALSIRNQDLRADAATGAATVLHVAAPAGTDLTAAVDAADPSGRYAMAVRERASEVDRGTGRVVAVDSRRLAAVSAWSPAWSNVTALAEALRPTTTAPVVLRGSRVVVTLDRVEVKPGIPLSATTGPADPGLSLIVDTGPMWRTVKLGAIARTNRLTGSIPCRGGCRLVAVGLTSGALQPYTARFVVTGVGTDVSPIADSGSWLGKPARWHPRVGDYYDPDPDASAIPSTTAAGLTLKVTDSLGGNLASVAPGDVIDPLPAVLGPTTELRPFAGMNEAAYGTGLDGAPQLLTVLGRASVLPRTLGDGVLVDLSNAAGLVDPHRDSGSAEVWLAPDAPAEIEPALNAAGLRVERRETLSDARAVLRREPTTRGAAVAVSLAETASVLTVLALVAARVVDGRRRRDWRILRDAGVRASTARRLAAIEVAVPALLGTVLGVLSGLAALHLAAPRLPLVDLSTPGPPPELRISWSPALVFSLIAMVVVVLIALIGARLETRDGRPER